MRKGLQGSLLRVFWQFLNPEAQQQMKTSNNKLQILLGIKQSAKNRAVSGTLHTDREGLWHAILRSVAGIIVQEWCLLLTHAGTQTLFIPSMIQEGWECAGCSRGIPQRELQEQLSWRRIAGLCPYCVYWNGRSEGVCLNLQHVESVQKRVGTSAYKHFSDLYHSFLTNRLIICKSRACLFFVHSNLLHHTSTDFISFSCSPSDTFSCYVGKRTVNTNILMCSLFYICSALSRNYCKSYRTKILRIWECLVATW